MEPKQQSTLSRAFRLVSRAFLPIYDFIVFGLSACLLYWIYKSDNPLTPAGFLDHFVIGFVPIFACRVIGKIYRQVWRYGGIQCYIRLMIADTVGGLLYLAAELLLPIQRIAFSRLLAFCCVNLLGALAIRMAYRYAYKCGGQDNAKGRFLRTLLKIFAFGRVKLEYLSKDTRTSVAIIGAGSVGVALAEDLLGSAAADLIPRCFIDSDPEKVGRDIHDIKVYRESEATLEMLREHEITEVIFAMPGMTTDRKMELFEYYQKAGFKVKVYDYPSMDAPGKKRQLRDFDIEDLLMRQEKNIITDQTRSYYKGKTILITGGGGSIGSELCRQLAKMEPKQIIVLDVYENTAYDLQQELNFAYKGQLNVKVEIVSITNKVGLNRVFAEYRPDITIHAAAHKHVPLMEKNCIEAVENNVFGTLNVVQCCKEYGCGRFMMVSTDKAVNPTNVMGATRIIETTKKYQGCLKQNFKNLVSILRTTIGDILESFLLLIDPRSEKVILSS